MTESKDNAVVCENCGHLGEPVVRTVRGVYHRECPFCGHPSESQRVDSLGDMRPLTPPFPPL